MRMRRRSPDMIQPHQAVDGNKARAGRTLGTAALAADGAGGGWVHVVDVCLRVKKGTGGDGAVKPEPYDGAGACLRLCWMDGWMDGWIRSVVVVVYETNASIRYMIYVAPTQPHSLKQRRTST